MSDKALPNWIKVDKKRFDRIINESQNAKNNSLHAKPSHGGPIKFDESINKAPYKRAN